MAMSTAEDIYDAARALSLPERLRLAALLLDGVSLPPIPLPNANNLPGYSDSWSEEDIRDLAAYAARYGSSISPDDEGLIPTEAELKAIEQEPTTFSVPLSKQTVLCAPDLLKS